MVGIRSARTRLSGPGAREFLWVVLGQLAAAAGAIVGVRLLTDVMNPGSYGELALAITIATFGQQILLGPLSVTGQRFYSTTAESNDLQFYVTSLTRLSWQLVGLLLIINTLTFAALALCWESGVSLHTFALATLFSVISGANTLFDGIQSAARCRRLVAWHQAAAQWLRFLIAAGCAVVINSSSDVVLFGYVIGSALVLISQFYFLGQLFKPELRACRTSDSADRVLTARMWNYMWPFMAWGIFAWLQFSADRWALGLFATTSAVGQYVVLYQLGTFPLVLLTNMLQQLVAPILFHRVGDASDSRRNDEGTAFLRKVNVLTAILVGVATSCAALLHRPIFAILASAEYRTVSYLLPYMVLAGGLFSAGQLAALRIVMGLDTTPLMPVKIGSGILGTALSFGGAYWFGLPGVVAATLCGSAIYYVWTLTIQAPVTAGIESEHERSEVCAAA